MRKKFPRTAVYAAALIAANALFPSSVAAGKKTVSEPSCFLFNDKWECSGGRPMHAKRRPTGIPSRPSEPRCFMFNDKWVCD